MFNQLTALANKPKTLPPERQIGLLMLLLPHIGAGDGLSVIAEVMMQFSESDAERARMRIAHDKLDQGGSIASALAATRLFDKHVAQLLDNGSRFIQVDINSALDYLTRVHFAGILQLGMTVRPLGKGDPLDPNCVFEVVSNKTQ